MKFIKTSKMSSLTRNRTHTRNSKGYYGFLPEGSMFYYRTTQKISNNGKSVLVSVSVSVPVPVPVQLSTEHEENISLLRALFEYRTNVMQALNDELRCTGSEYNKKLTINAWNVNTILNTLYRKFSSDQVHQILIKIQRDPSTSDDWSVGFDMEM